MQINNKFKRHFKPNSDLLFLACIQLENIHPLQKGCKRRKIFGTDKKTILSTPYICPSLVTSAASSTEVFVYLYFSLPNVANFI